MFLWILVSIIVVVMYRTRKKIVNQGFYVRLPTRACMTGYWGRRDLLDLTHWITNLIAEEIWTVKVAIFISPRCSIEPCTYRLSASECWQVSVLSNCATEGTEKNRCAQYLIDKQACYDIDDNVGLLLWLRILRNALYNKIKLSGLS